MYTSDKYIDRRREPRKPFSGKIFFATKKRLYEGDLLNFSNHGLFIKTSELLPLGKTITVALPYSENRDNKYQGRIIRCDRQGFGVKFLTNLEIRKSFERRKEHRLRFYGDILFATKKKLYIGSLIDYSNEGLGIKIQEPFAVGGIITVALPYSEEKPNKRKGKILWTNQIRIGVKLLEEIEQSPLIICHSSHL